MSVAKAVIVMNWLSVYKPKVDLILMSIILGLSRVYLSGLRFLYAKKLWNKFLFFPECKTKKLKSKCWRRLR